MILIDITSSVCPDSSLLKPCSCNKDVIVCGNRFQALDLVQMFERLGKQLPKTGKHFNEFHLSNALITELKENTFSDITFDKIFIQNCDSLKSIHKNAFNTTELVTIWLFISNNPQLTSTDNSIFEAASKFAQAQIFYLADNNITEIPSNAFKHKQDHMRAVTFQGSSIKKLGNNVFSNYKDLEVITIFRTLIDSIPENAFEFNEESNRTLTLYLTSNKFLNSSGFAEHSLTKFKRPCTIYLDSSPGDTNFPYFDEKIFEPFLKLNFQNIFISWDGSLDCSDCRNYWLQKNPALLKQIHNSKCSNGKYPNDPANFVNCKSLF